MSRTLKDEIQDKIEKVDVLRKTKTMSVAKACREAGIAYPTYLKHRKDAISVEARLVSSDRVGNAMTELIQAIRADLVEQIKARMGS